MVCYNLGLISPLRDSCVQGLLLCLCHDGGLPEAARSGSLERKLNHWCTHLIKGSVY